MSTEYRLARPVVVRLMGTALVLGGLLVLLVAVGAAVWQWPGAVLSTAVVLAAAGVVAVGLVLARRSTVVRFDDTGYVVRWVRGAGVRAGRWKEVEDAVATTVHGTRCVVLRRRDGSTTTIPVQLLDRDDDAFVRDLQAHLDRGHGYRRLR